MKSEIQARADQNLGVKNSIDDLEKRIATEREHGRKLRGELERTQATISLKQRETNEMADRIR